MKLLTEMKKDLKLTYKKYFKNIDKNLDIEPVKKYTFIKNIDDDFYIRKFVKNIFFYILLKSF